MKNINQLQSVDPVQVHNRNPNPNQSGHLAADLRPPSADLRPAFTGQFSPALHQQHRSLELPQVLELVRRHIGRQWWSTQVVGSWVWVHQSPTLRPAERSALFELGFHWNPRRQVWQHPCGILTPPAASGPLSRYFPAQQQAQSAQAA